jgi:26 proteasome complex subunit DSS1
MTEQTKPQPPTNVAVDLECDDEFEEFGNEGASTSRRTRNLPRSRVSPIFPTQTTRLPSSISPTPRTPISAEWGAEEEDAEDVKQWEEDWDDTDANDDFTRQLRAELQRHQ